MSIESRTLTLTNFYSFFVLFQQPSGLEQDISYLCLKTSAVTLSPLIYEHVRLIIFRKKNSAYPMLLKPTLLLEAYPLIKFSSFLCIPLQRRFGLKFKKVKHMTQAHKWMKLLASFITCSNVAHLEHVLIGSHSVLPSY